MAEQIISASGPQYGLVVNQDGSINVSGIDLSIGSLALSLENVYVQSGDNLKITSMPKTEVYGSGLFVGSITSMPSVSVTAGSESWIKGGSIEVYTGSIHVTNFSAGTGYAGSDAYIPAGSVIVTNTVTGSIISMPSVSVSTGSEVYVKNFDELGSSVVVTNLYAGSKFYQGDIYGVSGVVNVDNRVAGSIVNWPGSLAISNFNALGSNIVISNFNDLGSSVVVANFSDIGSSRVITNLYTGSELYQGERFGVSGIVEVSNTITGSIISMPDISVSVGSESWIKNFNELGSSVVITNFNDIGSSRVVTNMVAGSIVYMPDISVTTGSEVYVQNFNELGSSVVVTNLYAGSEVYQGTTPWIGSIISMPDINVSTGSEVYVQNFNDLGSSVVVTNLYAGSSVWQGERFGVSGIVGVLGSVEVFSNTGSVEVYGSLSAEAGSEVYVMNWNEIGSSVVVTNLYTGSSLYQGERYGISGIVDIGNFDDIGSSVVITNFSDIGSSRVITNFGDLGSSVVVTNFNDLGSSVVVTNLYAGSLVYQGTEPWVGSIISIPDISVSASAGITNLGSPSFKRGILSASGTYTNVWSIGGAGSKIEMHGYHISTNAPGYVRICHSGTTPQVISDYNLNYASGGQIEKTFVNPLLSVTADVPIGVGATVAGSTLVTIYGREVA